MNGDFIIGLDDLILVTGSNGFIGSRVIETLLRYGFTNLRCFVRPSSDLTALDRTCSSRVGVDVEIVKGNLLSEGDCRKATKDVSVILHLAAGIEKTFPGSYMKTVVTTKNLLESTLQSRSLKRFVNVGSFAVYTNIHLKRGGLLDEGCAIETQFMKRYEPYVYAKAKQDEMVMEYGKNYAIPYVIVRPGAVYGPGKNDITSRVGIDTFGVFLHLGGPNRVPITYVDNCAEAIVLAGIKKGVDGEVFNIVDDDLPTSREFLKMLKKMAGHFRSIYIPYRLFYVFCYLWEQYSKWSDGQLPPVFNRWRCAAYWKGNRYSNKKARELLGWEPLISFREASTRYCNYLRKR